jgi:hypothetical protein
MHPHFGMTPTPVNKGTRPGLQGAPRRLTLTDAELWAALTEARWSRAAACLALGCGRETLRRELHRRGMLAPGTTRGSRARLTPPAE